jgi:lipopolysaccharide export system protein LptC
MSVELHLPDLPEVPISLGPAPPAVGGPRRAALRWHLRLREALSAYLPLLLMGAIALATWWLVKNTPVPAPPAPPREVRSEPDYTMRGFALERFEADGRLVLRIEGDWLRHYPDTDRIEIEDAHIRAFGVDGRETVATAKRALGNGDGSEIQLLGGAEVTSRDAAGAPLLTIRGEFLHAFLVTERVRSHRPVSVRYGGAELDAAGIDYDNATRKLELRGPMRAVLSPKAGKAARAAKGAKGVEAAASAAAPAAPAHAGAAPQPAAKAATEERR